MSLITFASIQLNFLDRDMHFVTARATPIVYMTMRSNLDYLLTQEAMGAGAQVTQACDVTALRNCGDCVELNTSKGLMRAKTVIAADGANSKLARASGWSESRHLIPALEYEVAVGDKDFQRLGNSVRFDFGVTDYGYARVFPKRRHLSVGILTMQRGSINLNQELHKYLRLLAITDIVTIEKHGHVIPVSPRKGRLAKNSIFLVGDAAGLADPVTAEGISYAIISGQLAAKAILTQSSMSDAASCYQTLLEAQVLSELKAARVLANILYRWPRLRNLCFRLSGQKLCEYVTDVVVGDKSYREAVRKPTSYLEAFGLWRR